MGNTDPNNTKVGKEIRGQASVRRAIKQPIMKHAIINATKCMRAIKGRIARPVNQLANHLSRASIPHTVYQPGKSSVRDLQSPSAHHSSVVFRHNQSLGHHSDDSVGLFRHDTSVGQSQRGSKSGHQSICKSGSRCMHVWQFNIQYTMHTIQYVKTECKTQSIHKLYHVNHRSISADFTTSITAMFTLKAAKSAQFVPSTADSTSTDLSQGTKTHGLGYQLSPGFLNHGRIFPGAEIC
ncbi:hypothetical protein F511_32642 [Dorcoceras hygrometricum]|uniref:Uncharacterized protein n=1 Tax=Dorcoceras hygrometricum TaxID=472368 RepID=A0A2Z7BFE5_9LAMI|nr:hypothetical protein F511_32642 [Dorcoceras hygrometricum]